MQNNQSKKIAQGALMVAIFTILTLLVNVPVLGLVVYFFAPFPIAWYSAKYDRKASIIMAVVGCVTPFIYGGIVGLLLAVILAITGLVIGEGLRTKKSKLYIYLSTAITVLIIFAVQYIILVNLFSMDFIKESLDIMRKAYEEQLKISQAALPSNVSPEEMLDMTFQSLEMGMPAIITLGVFLHAILTIAAIFPLLKRFHVNVPSFGKFLNLKLPKIVLWLYFIALIINLFMQPEIGTPLYVIVYNFSIILWVLLTLQGLSFIFYCLESYRAPKFLKGLSVILAGPLYNIFVLLGILDLGFNIRGFVKGKIQK